MFCFCHFVQLLLTDLLNCSMYIIVMLERKTFLYENDTLVDDLHFPPSKFSNEVDNNLSKNIPDNLLISLLYHFLLHFGS